MIVIMFQAEAVLLESSRLITTEILLQKKRLDPLVALYYFAPVRPFAMR
jgi:hypothetical protein